MRPNQRDELRFDLYYRSSYKTSPQLCWGLFSCTGRLPQTSAHCWRQHTDRPSCSPSCTHTAHPFYQPANRTLYAIPLQYFGVGMCKLLSCNPEHHTCPYPHNSTGNGTNPKLTNRRGSSLRNGEKKSTGSHPRVLWRDFSLQFLFQRLQASKPLIHPQAQLKPSCKRHTQTMSSC